MLPLLSHPRSEQGFTLVELMVALFIFSLLSVAGVTLLRSSADGQAVLSESLGDNNKLVRTAALIRSDLRYALARPTRDGGSAFRTSGSVPGTLFDFAALKTSSVGRGSQLDRISYAFQDNRLLRYRWTAVDGGQPGEPASLLDQIGKVDIRYRGDDGQWSQSPPTGKAIPRAIELQMVTAQGQDLRIVALVGAQARADQSDEQPEETVDEQGNTSPDQPKETAP